MNQWIGIFVPHAEDVFPVIPPSLERHARLTAPGACVCYRRDGRFSADCLFESDACRITLADGIHLNLTELEQTFSVPDLSGVIRSARAADGETYCSRFSGPFSGLDWNQEARSLIAYTSQIGDPALFYAREAGFFAVTNDLNLLLALFRANGVPWALDELAAHYLLTFGYMADDRTPIDRIKRIFPGELVAWDGGAPRRRVYHRFRCIPAAMSMEDAVRLVDESFLQAVRRCFDKDLEYGYTVHLADMSGGLDSRIMNFAARRAGYGPVVNVSYSQSGTQEQRCASIASATLGNQFLHKQLDDAGFLLELDRIIRMNYGLADYSGITGGAQFLRLLNLSGFGLEHTGQVGDSIVGCFCDSPVPTPPDSGRIRSSLRMDVDVPPESMAGFANNEEYCLYVRGFLGALSSHLSRRHYCYPVSPFLDPAFLQTCLTIPLEYRVDHRLYWKWVDTCYPEAAALPTTRHREDPRKGTFGYRLEKHLLWRWGRIRSRLGLPEKKGSDLGMNPFDLWMQQIPELSRFFQSYHDQLIGRLDPYPATKERVETLFAGDAMEKCMALTVLGVMKNDFDPDTLPEAEQ